MSSLSVRCPQCGKTLRLRDRSLLGRPVNCPGCKQQVVLREASESVAEQVSGTVAQPAAAAPSEPVIPTFEAVESAATLDRLRDIKQRNRSRRNVSLILTAVVLVGFAVSVYALRDQIFSANQAGDADDQPSDVSAAKAELAVESISQDSPPTVPESPTDGEPIKLTAVPAGARIVIHMRTAELWQSESLGEECLQCLGPLKGWAESKIVELCGFEPTELEEVLICLIPGPRGQPVDVSIKARLAEPRKRSELLLKFGGRRIDDYDVPVYVDEQRVYWIDDDLRTIAVGPAEMAGEVAGSIEFPNPTSPGIEALLSNTDRQRHVTMVFEPIDLQLHAGVLFSQSSLGVVEALLEWLGEDTEALLWSVHLSDTFFTELVLRNRDAKESRAFLPKDLLEEMQDKLGEMPRQVLSAVESMDPRAAGRRRVIGRFPAMMKVGALSTRGEVGQRFVRLAALLPERAGPNLALGARLAWDEATRTDFDASPRQSPGPSAPQAASVAERLRLPVEIDFRSTPFEDALSYIGERIGVSFEIDGNALRGAGYTRNEQQNFTLGHVPAIQALKRIADRYELLVLIVEEDKGRVLVTTAAAAQEKGLEPYSLVP